ncbi:MAG: GDP/UDP-N,N'-diacetylbacillosamine 2-epimerase (hydrolyzing) [Alphaproteobacteria bacterium MarineAlpha9_Bin3]|nr:MAG: GDP/UDP-N,N'-diacetylbacillosamine 2-epimerase (hydrolyzing) [Alphaproteobacteria bacterium MarineAlpha9_Bin3]|tara:strand:- start:5460 stop:6677 length:1218 start_codon:yes stop_codon:yes gene_type:complete
MKKKIAIFTGNRAEYGLQIPLLRAISKDPNLDYCLIVSGAHLDPNYGSTIREIEEDGFVVHEAIDIKSGSANLLATSNSIGEGIIKITKIIEKVKPDIFVIYADRYETFAAAIASSQTNTVTAHIEGGDITEGGALDDSVRHAITKLSHIHFTTNQQASNRILAMGEEKWRVHTVGYPGIDLINAKEFFTPEEIVHKIQIDLKKPIIVFTQHSVSNKFNLAEKQLLSTLNAFDKLLSENDIQCILTYPNNDAGGDNIYSMLESYSLNKNNVTLHQSLGRKLYWGLLNLAKDPKYRIVCVGNSSSGIKETPAFGCTVVNIGTRQLGRLRADNVLDANYNVTEIYNAIYKCLYDDRFRDDCRKCINPYGIGNTGSKIVEVIKNININDKLLTKKMTNKGIYKNGWFQ